MKDNPEAIVVVIFPDNILKYATSVQRHFPAMFNNATEAPSTESANGQLLETLIGNSRNPYDTIEVDAASQFLQDDKKPLLIDVRDQITFRKEHVVGAINMPLDELSKRAAELPDDREAPIFTVCNRGNMSLSGLLILKSHGYRNVRSINGGTVAWREKGFAVEAF